MTISGYSNAIVDVMLGWLKGLANWVLRLFNLAGSASGSPLVWLSRNWLKLLIFFLVLGVVLDRLIWLIRWRPYWVWFRKERVIVNDDRFFAGVDMDKASEWEGDLISNWDEHDYVVASTVVKRQSPSQDRGDRAREERRGQPGAGRRREGTRVQRRAAPSRPADAKRRYDGDKPRPERDRDQARQPEKAPDSFFAVDLGKRDVSDSYEDEVFNVANLPVFDEFEAQRRPQKAKKAKNRNSGTAGRRAV